MTLQEIIDRARPTLNDDTKLSWADSELLLYANEFLDSAKMLHPDWFFNQYAALPSDLVLTSDWPINRMYAPACTYYVLARANMKDAEEAFQGAVAPFMQGVTALS